MLEVWGHVLGTSAEGENCIGLSAGAARESDGRDWLFAARSCLSRNRRIADMGSVRMIAN